ncbi:MAG: hypothetical protein NUW22_12685 [Acidobacteria bacterium]|nr:hypothetical protein [Acidobacteriota bacterium]
MPNLTYQRPWLYDKQRDAIFCAERYGICEATTKAGKTAGCMVWLLEQAMAGKDGQNFWWTSPIRDQAKVVYRRMKRALPREIYQANETELTLTLANGATLWYKGADHPDSLYGDDVYAAVVDEASRCKEDAWHAIRSTLTATRGPVRIIGNVKGRKNWAYHLARKAESGEPGMHYAKLTAYDAVEAGILQSEEVEDARRQLPDAVFRELYLAEPSDDGGNPFGLAAIAACVGAPGDLPPIAWGIDLAKSVDWTVLVGLNADGAVCQFERFQKPWEDTIATILARCGTVPALVDSTGVGDPVLEALQKRSRDAGGQMTGFKFTSGSKQQLMEGLAVAIQRQAVRFPDGPIRAELDSFEYQYTRTGVSYSAPDGQHDDCVCALALAVAQLQQIRPALQFWGGHLVEPLTDEQRHAEAVAAREASAQLVKDTINTDGVFWPGGR